MALRMDRHHEESVCSAYECPLRLEKRRSARDRLLASGGARVEVGVDLDDALLDVLRTALVRLIDLQHEAR